MRRDVIRFIYWPISFNERDLKRNINMILNEVVLLCHIKYAFQYIIERGESLLKIRVRIIRHIRRQRVR